MPRSFFRLVVGALALVLSLGIARAQELPDFTHLVAKEGPVVVNISTTSVVHDQDVVTPDQPDGDPFWQLFRQFGLPAPQIPHESRVQSLGSGFIISSDGYILTNAHVVQGAQDIVVRLNDRRQFKARLVGLDKRTDIAVLKIKASGLPVASLGDPNALKPGQWVVAIGEPFGLENTVTAGIVSATGRSLPSDAYVPFIQTDVPINPGNSGGPLFNMAGQVVGINSQIYTRSGGYMGLSFAIPIDVALDVSQQLREHGHVIRGYLGVTIQDVTYDLAESFGMTKAEGALIAQVNKDSPAERAGLKPSDVVLRIDGRSVDSAADMERLISLAHPGKVVHLVIWRNHQMKTLTATLGELPAASQTQSAQAGPAAPNRLGIVATEPSPAQRQKEGLRQGLVVQSVQGLAAQVGIQPGDIVLALNDTPLHTVAQFDHLLAKLESGRSVALLMRRGSESIYIAMTLPDK